MSGTSGNIALLALTVVAAGALAANRFVDQDGTYPAAGAKAFGVTRFEALNAGEALTCDILGTTIVETGAAVAKDADLMVDATGRVVTATTGVKRIVAVSMEAAAAAGAFIEVLLTPGGGTSAA